MKRMIMIGGGVVVVLIAALVFVWLNVGSVIKAAVEKYGPEILQAEVTLDEADVSASSGNGYLRGLTVGNPSGFKTENAFTLGNIDVTVDTGTITGDIIVVKEIVIEAPNVTYEYTASGNNLMALKENAEAYTGGAGGASGDASSDEAGGKKLIIEDLYIRGGRVNVSADFLGGRQVGASLPEIHLTDIGKDSGGAGPGEIAEKVIAAITAAAGKAVSTIDVEGLSKAAQEQMGAVKDRASEVMDKAADSLPTGDAVKEGLGGAGDALKGLFGGKKE